VPEPDNVGSPDHMTPFSNHLDYILKGLNMLDGEF
jgi:hypothetical protein